jgi:hypothetical protein
MKIALDTNVLAYAEGTNGTAMRDKELKLILQLPPTAIVWPVQTLGELFNVLVRKAKRRPARARMSVTELAGRTSGGRDLRRRDGQRNRSGVQPWPFDLGFGCAGRVGGCRVQLAFVGRPPGRLQVAWNDAGEQPKGLNRLAARGRSRPGSAQAKGV